MAFGNKTAKDCIDDDTKLQEINLNFGCINGSSSKSSKNNIRVACTIFGGCLSTVKLCKLLLRFESLAKVYLQMNLPRSIAFKLIHAGSEIEKSLCASSHERRV